MNRFFVFEKQNDYFILPKATLEHLKVIRVKNKEFICVFEENFYVCVLEENKAKIVSKLNLNHEFNFEVTLAMSIIKLDRFEWMLQKATELGVTKIIPVASQYCDGDLVKYKFNKKRERFETILQNAAEQSFRNKIPVLLPIIDFEQAVKIPSKYKFIAHEKVSVQDSKRVSIDDECLLFVGPEGGFSDAEIALAEQHDIKAISLGKRILRAETAALYLLSQIEQK